MKNWWQVPDQYSNILSYHKLKYFRSLLSKDEISRIILYCEIVDSLVHPGRLIENACKVIYPFFKKEQYSGMGEDAKGFLILDVFKGHTTKAVIEETFACSKSTKENLKKVSFLSWCLYC